MLGEDKNLKDSQTQLGISLKDNSFPLAYKKTDKLITALYMVTDILDKEEPIRNKLRTIGAEVISDISLFYFSNNIGLSPIGYADLSSALNKKIAQILSFLEIGFTVGMISEMNFSILKKEFLELKNSTEEFKAKDTLEDLFKENENEIKNVLNNQYHSIGHTPIRQPTRIGVQKGSTLLKALSDKMNVRYIGGNNTVNNKQTGFNDLKEKRRAEIISIIKDKMKGNHNFTGVSITDVVRALRSLGVDRGEKTLQRELVSMVADGILKKTGEKRWSRYRL